MDKVICSFSGGETSGYMAAMLKREYGDNLITVYMNTGMEHPKTLEFIKRCDKEFNIDLICLEAVVNPIAGKVTKHTIVDVCDLSDDLSIAKSVVSKYGLYGVGFLHCTREMKLRPFKSWKKDTGNIDSLTAIGIRADEIDRIPEDYEKRRQFYPLADKGVTKAGVRAFWDAQDFKLEIEGYLGNCVGCWKKSSKKLYQIAREIPSEIEKLKELEGMATKGSSKMFRGNLNCSELMVEAGRITRKHKFDADPLCGESCEI